MMESKTAQYFISFFILLLKWPNCSWNPFSFPPWGHCRAPGINLHSIAASALQTTWCKQAGVFIFIASFNYNYTAFVGCTVLCLEVVMMPSCCRRLSGALDFCPYAAISGARILWRTLLCLADKLSQTACPSVLRFMVAWAVPIACWWGRLMRPGCL